MTFRIPCIFCENERPDLLPVIMLALIIIHTAFDAVNNVAVIRGYDLAYNVAHVVLSTTNIVSGTFVGTGDSIC